MNIFYAPPSQIQDERIELSGQEAIHASKALRFSRGDAITVVDSKGGWYEGKVQHVARQSVQIVVKNRVDKSSEEPTVSLAMGIIKKRDRLEFAVEKAVELGVKEIILFRGAHTVKQNIRRDRLQMVAISAMKQSLQAWLPKISFCKDLAEVVKRNSSKQLIAAKQGKKPITKVKQHKLDTETLLLVGPEGGFSEGELAYLAQQDAAMVSISTNRLRTETAALAFLSHFYLFLSASPIV